MATIQVVVDEKLLERLDSELQGASRKRSAFIRQALSAELRRREQARLDEQDRLAYLEPQTAEERAEQSAWERLQDWGEPWDSKDN